MAIRIGLAAAVAVALVAGCASRAAQEEAALTGRCERLQATCNARCERDFEADPDAWAWRSCLQSCRPSDRSQCAGVDITRY